MRTERTFTHDQETVARRIRCDGRREARAVTGQRHLEARFPPPLDPLSPSPSLSPHTPCPAVIRFLANRGYMQPFLLQ